MLKTPDGGGGLAISWRAVSRQLPTMGSVQPAPSEQLVRPAGPARILTVGLCSCHLRAGNIMEGCGRARPLYRPLSNDGSTQLRGDRPSRLLRG